MVKTFVYFWMLIAAVTTSAEQLTPEGEFLYIYDYKPLILKSLKNLLINIEKLTRSYMNMGKTFQR